MNSLRTHALMERLKVRARVGLSALPVEAHCITLSKLCTHDLVSKSARHRRPSRSCSVIAASRACTPLVAAGQHAQLVSKHCGAGRAGKLGSAASAAMRRGARQGGTLSVASRTAVSSYASKLGTTSSVIHAHTETTSSDGAERGAWLRGACERAVQCSAVRYGRHWRTLKLRSMQQRSRDARGYALVVRHNLHAHASHGSDWVRRLPAALDCAGGRRCTGSQWSVPLWLQRRSHLATASIPLGYGRVASPPFARSSSASPLPCGPVPCAQCHGAQCHGAQCHAARAMGLSAMEPSAMGHSEASTRIGKPAQSASVPVECAP
jgi:hypothetical protein